MTAHIIKTMKPSRGHVIPCPQAHPGPATQIANQRTKCLGGKSVLLVCRQTTRCLFEACVDYRLSTGEPAGPMWETQPRREEAMVATENKSAPCGRGSCPTHPGDAAGRLDGGKRTAVSLPCTGVARPPPAPQQSPVRDSERHVLTSQIHSFLAKA